MYSFTRRATLAVLLLAALLAVLGAHAVQYPLDGSQTTFTNTALNGDTFQFTVLGTTGETVRISIDKATVTGGGVTFQGFGTTDETAMRKLAVDVNNMEVTGASVTIAGIMPRLCTVTFSNPVATGLTGPMFKFVSLSLAYNATIIISGPSATWADPATGQSMFLKSGPLLITTNSALFIERPKTSSAIASVYSAAADGGSTQVRTNSVFAIDALSCVACSDVAVNMGTAQTELDVNSFLRITTATAGKGGIVNGNYNLVEKSAVEVSGTVSSTTADYIPGFVPTISTDSRVTLGPFTGGSQLGTNYDSAGPTYATSTSTTSTGTLDTKAKWGTAGVTGNVVIVDSNYKGQDGCVNAHCLGDSIVVGSGTDCACACGADAFIPYCTSMYDPSVAFDDGDDGCPAGTEPGTGDEASKCVPTTCKVANCKACCSIDKTTCCECDIGYVLNLDTRRECILCTQRLPGCSQCIDWNTCGTCSGAYQVVGNTCTRRPTGNSASGMQPTVIGALLLLVSSVAVYIA